MSSLLKLHFPKIQEQVDQAATSLAEKYPGFKPMFGSFFNFCINASIPKKKVPHIFCLSHVDAMNMAAMVCTVLVYCIGHSECSIYLSFYVLTMW